MKTELKSVVFDSPAELTVFVNKNKITKENIQSINAMAFTFTLFYWEVTE